MPTHPKNEKISIRMIRAAAMAAIFSKVMIVLIHLYIARSHLIFHVRLQCHAQVLHSFGGTSS